MDGTLKQDSRSLGRRGFLIGTAEQSLALTMFGVVGLANSSSAAAQTGTTEAGLSLNATPREIAESYWLAEAERNVEKVGQHYHADATFIPPGSDRLIGWNSIRKWYQETYRKFHKVHVEITHEITNGNEACFEWQAMLTDTAGKVYNPIGVNIVRVEGGKYREVRAYFDSSIL